MKLNGAIGQLKPLNYIAATLLCGLVLFIIMTIERLALVDTRMRYLDEKIRDDRDLIKALEDRVRALEAPSSCYDRRPVLDHAFRVEEPVKVRRARETL